LHISKVVLIPARQIGQARPWRKTSLAHDSQKRWWPHGTNSMRASRSAARQTSQQSSLTAAVSCAVALALAQTAFDWSKVISHYLRQVTFSFPYFVVLAFSSPEFSTRAVWCHVFKSRVSVLAFSAPPSDRWLRITELLLAMSNVHFTLSIMISMRTVPSCQVCMGNQPPGNHSREPRIWTSQGLVSITYESCTTPNDRIAMNARHNEFPSERKTFSFIK